MAPAHSMPDTQTHTWNMKYVLVFLYEAPHTYFPREFLVILRKLLALDSLQTELNIYVCFLSDILRCNYIYISLFPASYGLL